MEQTTSYTSTDLEEGKCKCCNDNTDIVIGDGRCPECIFDEAFFNETMK